MLASTAVGTLEFRSVALPVRDIQPALNLPLNNYLTAWARAINTKDKIVLCVTTDGQSFNQPYDQLVIATGAAGSTFGIPGAPTCLPYDLKRLLVVVRQLMFEEHCAVSAVVARLDSKQNLSLVSQILNFIDFVGPQVRCSH